MASQRSEGSWTWEWHLKRGSRVGLCPCLWAKASSGQGTELTCGMRRWKVDGQNPHGWRREWWRGQFPQ